MSLVDYVFHLERRLTAPRVLHGWSRFRDKLSDVTVEALLSLGICLLILASFIQSFSGLALFAREQPLVGGIYREAVVGKSTLPNPLYASEGTTDRDVVSLVFSGLGHKDGKGNVAPDLAKHWSTSPDHKTYSIELQPDARFHDGIRFTATDVAFTVRLVQSPDYDGPYKGDWQGVTVAVKDATHLTLTLSSPYRFFNTNLTMPILPEHLLREIPVQSMRFADFNNHPIGTGPYRFDSLDTTTQAAAIGGRQQQIVLKRNADFYGQEPYIQTVYLRVYDTAHHAYEAYVRREVDAISQVSAVDLPKASRWSKLRQYKTELSQEVALFANPQSQILADKALRKAIEAGIDRRGIVAQDLAGLGHPIRLAVLPGSPGYDPSISTPDYSKTSAEQQLDQLGWVKGASGVRAKDGKPLKLIIATLKTDEYQRDIETLKQQMDAIGVSLDLHLLDASQFQKEVLGSRHYDLLLFGESLGSGDLYAFWHSTLIDSTNLARYKNDRVDKSLEVARTSFDQATLEDRYKRLAAIIADDAPAIFLYQPIDDVAIDQRVHGVMLSHLDTSSDRWTLFSQRYVNYRPTYTGGR